MPTLIVIAGPTASGKTAFAIKVAKALNTVILSADSRQFYKEMSIGTAAPTEEELSQVQHYFVHHISIEDKYDVADYERDALQLLEELFKTHDAVVMTGGSGLFIDAVCNGIDEMPDIKPEIREKVENLLKEEGLKAMQDEVQRLDPEYFTIVDQQNPRRLQRALEVCYQTGKTFTSFRSGNTVKRDFDIKKYALLWEREALIEGRSQIALSQASFERTQYGGLQGVVRLFRRAMHPSRGRGTHQNPHTAVCQAADDLAEEGCWLSMDYDAFIISLNNLANSTISPSVVSKAHIQRTTSASSSQS